MSNAIAEVDKKAEAMDRAAAEFIPSEKDIANTDKLSVAKIKDSEFPWDDALDTYDPDFPNYKPSRDAIEFFMLMRVVQGSDFEVGNSIAQYFMVDLLFGNVTTDMFPYSKEINDLIHIDPDRTAVCCSRGLSKSTLITNFMFIYVALKGELPNDGLQQFWLALGASSKGHARNMALSLKAVCEDSAYLNDPNVMEYTRFTETEAEFLRAGTGPEKSRYFCIRFLGIFTPSRGQKNKFNARPDLAVLDDCLPSHSAAYSPTIMATLETAIHSDLANALKADGGKIWNIFTPFNYNEPNTSSILNGSFTPLLIPVAAAFNDEEHLDIDEIRSSWDEMHTRNSIYKMWDRAVKSKTLKLFMQERMLRLTSGAERLIPDDCLQFCDMKPIIKNIDYYNIYITTDYTTTSGEDSDFSGIATWAVSSNEDWFLLNLTLKKRSMEQQYAETILEAAQWKRKGKNVQIGVEVDGNQQAHIHSLEKVMSESGQWYTFAKQKSEPYGTRKGILSRATGVKKHERFRIASNVLLQKKMWFPKHLENLPDMREFMSQIKGATHQRFTRADDGPDLITMALVSMYVVYPVESRKENEILDQNKTIDIGNGMMIEVDYDDEYIDAGSGY